MRQPRRDAIDLVRPVRQPLELRQCDRRAAEAVGLHEIGAGAEIGEMDVADQVGPRQVQDLRAVLLAAIIALDIEVERLDAAAHGAVAQQHAPLQGLEQAGHRR